MCVYGELNGRLNIFGDDQEEEEEEGVDRVVKASKLGR